jgi:hypothetical protein
MKKSKRAGVISGVRRGRAARKTKAVWVPPELPETRTLLPGNSAGSKLPVPKPAVAASNRAVWVPPDLPEPRPVPIARANDSAGRSAALPAAHRSAQASDRSSVSRPRLVFGVDATASREPAWDAAVPLTDVLLRTLPGKLDAALAVHGGNEVHWSEFTSDPRELRDRAAGVRCRAGETRLLEILRRVLELDGVGVVVYIGDMFEESPREARRLADALLLRGTRVIVLHDTSSGDMSAKPVFQMLAQRTGGAVLPFDISALDRLGELLQAVAVLAVDGMEGLQANRETMPATMLLLEHISISRALILRE